MWTDEAVLAALREHGLSVNLSGGDFDLSYVIDDIHLSPGLLDVRVTGYQGNSARFELALPSSGQPQPWLYAEPGDEQDWVSQLFIWLDEQACTGGLTPTAAHRFKNGQRYRIFIGDEWLGNNDVDPRYAADSSA